MSAVKQDVIRAPSPDKAEIIKALNALFDPRDVVELRAFHKGRKRTNAGYFDSEHRDKLAEEAKCLSTKGAAVYVTLNRLDPQVLRRYANRVEHYAQATATDANVLKRRWLMLDFDPVRPKDTSATDELLKVAKDRARRCYQALKDDDWPEPLAAESGNGMHLLYPLDLPNDPESRELIKGVLAGLAQRFDTEVVTVDQSVFNAARIVKLYGTVANKGDHTAIAPWRVSRLVSTPVRAGVVTVAQLRALHPPAEVYATDRAPTHQSFELADFLNRLGIEYRQDIHEGRDRYKLSHCPFNAEHGKGEAAIFQRADGKLGFKCQHNGCSDKTWQDVRALVDGPREARRTAVANAKPSARVAVTTRSEITLAGAGEAEQWPEPNTIKAELSPVELLPTAIIPEPYRAWIADVSERMQTPPDFLATAAIVATGSIIGTACTIKPKRRDDWLIVPNLWGGAVGRPSVLLKTPAMKEALNPLARLECDARQAYEAAKLQHEADVEMHKAKRDAIKHRMKVAAKKKAENITDLKFELCNLIAPDEPVWRRYKTNDATIEKCNELMRDNPCGLLIFRDELMGLLAGWEKPGRESDRAYFLEGWNGNQGHTDDRIGRGTTYAENVCISLFGGIQPSKLQSYLYQCMRGLDNDGLVQRLQLAVYPDEPESWELIDRYPDADAKRRVYDIIEKLSKADFTSYGARLDEGDKFLSLRFATDAQALFYEWLTELQSKLQGEDEPVVLEHLGKYRSLMPSLALIFHLIEVADGTAQPGPVSFRAAEMAAAWCDYLESHARRIYGLVTNATQQAAATLAGKLAKGKLEDGFTVRDVYRQNWHLLTDRESAQNACDELVGQGWLREEITPAAFGQKEKIAYLVNPKVRVR